MMNILRDVLEDVNQDNNNNLNSFSNLLNNIQSTLINASDRLPSIINEINDNLSSLEESNMEDDTEEENIRGTSNNTIDSQTNTLENDYMNLIQTGNLRAQINNPNSRIIMLTGYGNIPTAVAAIKEGAIDYLAKPADADDVEKFFMQLKLIQIQMY